ncbi:hypothetical protein [uncultured Maribacter sp.]|tara:strand:- start:162 stop:293 length:132 start_codon:yes stop_codon:yes gene_type:complete
MSIGKPKKLRFAEGLQKIEKAVSNVEADLSDISLVHKDKNYRV